MHKKYGRYDFQYESTKLRNTYLNSVSNSSGVKFSQPNALNLDLDRPDVKDSDEYRRFPNGLIYSQFNNFKSTLSMLLSCR